MQTEHYIEEESIHTIACWPGGKVVRFKGDPYDLDSGVLVFDADEWRPATPKELVVINHNVVAENFAKDIWCCQTSLVNRLLQEEIIGTDDIINEFEPDSAFDSFHALILTVTDTRNGGSLKFPGDNDDDARLSAESMMTGHGTDEEIIEALEELISERKTTIGRIEYTLATEVVTREFIESMDGDTTLYERADGGSDDPREILEWWSVDTHLAESLAAIGETVIDSEYGCWWGRRTSGQPFIQDGTLQRVVAHKASEG